MQSSSAFILTVAHKSSKILLSDQENSGFWTCLKLIIKIKDLCLTAKIGNTVISFFVLKEKISCDIEKYFLMSIKRRQSLNTVIACCCVSYRFVVDRNKYCCKTRDDLCTHYAMTFCVVLFSLIRSSRNIEQQHSAMIDRIVCNVICGFMQGKGFFYHEKFTLSRV